MHDVTWRTGCTITILLLLVLLGSGRLLEGPDQASAPVPSEDASGAGPGAGPVSAEAGTALSVGREGTAAPGATASAYRLASYRLPAPR